MAVFRSDRGRRMAGDRIVSRIPAFKAVHSAVGEAAERFAVTHNELGKRIDERIAEQSDDALARETRDQLTERAIQVYAWGYTRLDGLLQGSWEQPYQPDRADRLRGELFPLGNPSGLANGSQLAVDAMRHLHLGLQRNPDLGYSEAFGAEVAQLYGKLEVTLKQVGIETDETKAATEQVTAARQVWDQHRMALEEITTGFLRFEGRVGEIDSLMYSVRKGTGATPSDEELLDEGVEPVVDALDEAETAEPIE